MSVFTDSSSKSDNDSNTNDDDSDSENITLAKVGRNHGGKDVDTTLAKLRSKSQISSSPNNRPRQPIPEAISVMMTNEHIPDDYLTSFECSIMASRLPLLCLVIPTRNNQNTNITMISPNVNMRLVEWQRITSKNSTSLIKTYINMEGDLVNPLGGAVTATFFSFEFGHMKGESLPKPVKLSPCWSLKPSEQTSGVMKRIDEKYAARHVTIANVYKGLTWLTNKETTVDARAKSVEEALKLYINAINEIPINGTFEELKVFYDDHEWNVDLHGDEDSSSTPPGADRIEKMDKAKLRRFIQERLPYQTGIAIGIVDGVHRATTMYFAPLGILPEEAHVGSEELQEMKLFLTSLEPSSQDGRLMKAVMNRQNTRPQLVDIDTTVDLKCKLPREPEKAFDQQFCTAMLCISAALQQVGCRSQPHTLKEAIHHIMSHMMVDLDDRKDFSAGYLFKSNPDECWLTKAWKEDFGKSSSYEDLRTKSVAFLSKTDVSREAIDIVMGHLDLYQTASSCQAARLGGNYIKCWIHDCSNWLKRSLDDFLSNKIQLLNSMAAGFGTALHRLVSLEAEEWNSLFKSKDDGAKKKKKKPEYSMIPCLYKGATIDKRLKNNIGEPHIMNYLRSTMIHRNKVMSQQAVEFIWIAFWCCLDSNTQILIKHTVSANSVDEGRFPQEYDRGTAQEHVQMRLTGLVNVVSCSVRASKETWKKGMPMDPKARQRWNGMCDTGLVASLLGNAVSECIKFCSRIGLHPAFPKLLSDNRSLAMTRICDELSTWKPIQEYSTSLFWFYVYSFLAHIAQPSNDESPILQEYLKSGFRVGTEDDLIDISTVDARKKFIETNTIGGEGSFDLRGVGDKTIVALVQTTYVTHSIDKFVPELGPTSEDKVYVEGAYFQWDDLPCFHEFSKSVGKAKHPKSGGDAKNPPELLAQKMQQGTTEDGHNITKDNTKKGGGPSVFTGKKGSSPPRNRGKRLFGNKRGKLNRPPPAKGGDNEGEEEHGRVEAAGMTSPPAVAKKRKSASITTDVKKKRRKIQQKTKKNYDDLWNILGPEQVEVVIGESETNVNPQNDIKQVKARLQAVIDDEDKLTSLCAVLETDRALKREMLQMDEETKAKKTKEETNPKKVRANHMPDNKNTGVEDEALCLERPSDETESIIANTSEEQEKINNWIDDGNPKNNEPHLHRELDNINFQHNDQTGDNYSDGGQELDACLLGVGGDDEVLDNLEQIGPHRALDWSPMEPTCGETQGLLNKHTTGDRS